MDYSVLISVYKNSKANEVKQCLDSLYNQTMQSNDIVIVIDGPIGDELNNFLLDEQTNHSEITLVPIEQNVGLGNALKHGMPFCKNEIVARMDSDDICVNDRCAKQLQILIDKPEISIVGCNIAEFINKPSNIVSYRNCPEFHDDIVEFMKKRCPFNHMGVMFRKGEVEKAGGYLDWHYDEDSYLWVRMYLAGCKFYNIQENLVIVRINEDTFMRRGGYSYYKSERDLFRFMKKKKIISSWQYFKSKTVRFIVYVLMPNWLRAWSFKKFVRGKKN